MEPGVNSEDLAVSMAGAIKAARDRTSRHPLAGHGALFLGEETLHHGAVGCFLQGNFNLDIHSFPGAAPPPLPPRAGHDGGGDGDRVNCPRIMIIW